MYDLVQAITDSISLWYMHISLYLAGVDIIRKALSVPITQIVKNTGIEPEAVITQVLESGSNYGYDALTSQHVDMMNAGIVDPTKVCCLTSLIYNTDNLLLLSFGSYGLVC